MGLAGGCHRLTLSFRSTPQRVLGPPSVPVPPLYGTDRRLVRGPSGRRGTREDFPPAFPLLSSSLSAYQGPPRTCAHGDVDLPLLLFCRPERTSRSLRPRRPVNNLVALPSAPTAVPLNEKRVEETCDWRWKKRRGDSDLFLSRSQVGRISVLLRRRGTQFFLGYRCSGPLVEGACQSRHLNLEKDCGPIPWELSGCERSKR